MQQTTKRRRLMASAVVIFATVGCNATQRDSESLTVMNTWLVNTLYRSAEENALISQSTVFPYLFDRDSANLNDLGEGQVGVLALHLKEHPGRLSVRQGDAAEDLYRDRIQAVIFALEKAGVTTRRIVIEDQLPPGEGSWSERVLKILNPVEGNTPAI